MRIITVFTMKLKVISVTEKLTRANLNNNKLIIIIKGV